MKLLIFPAIDEQRRHAIAAAAQPMQVVNAGDLPRALREIEDADAFFGKITRELLARAGRLRWVQTPTASLEHYLFPELVEHPCLLSNTRGLFSDVIADHVMGFVICFARNFHHYIRQQAQRRWEPIGGEQARSDFIMGPGVPSPIDAAHRHLADATLGVVGVGHIGAEVVRRARSFGMRVVGVDPKTTSVPGALAEVWPLERLDELLAACDFVVIAAPHTPRTVRLFHKPRFECMRRDAILINIGRGAIVDLRDLTWALEQGVIGGAGLDVFETEPLPADHPLWSMPNVIITPHVAGTSPRIAQRHLQTVVENVRLFAAGQPPATLVDKRQWY